MKPSSLFFAFLLAVSLPTLRAAENLLPPLFTGSPQAGESVASPWASSDGDDNGLVSVKLGSPEGGKADWVEIKDDSPVNTANLRCLKLEPVAKGELSFEIFLNEGADGIVTVSLGLDGVTDVATRVLSCRFAPEGNIILSSHDSNDQSATEPHPLGQPRTYRLKFNADDKGSGLAQLFEGKNTRPIAELKTSDPLVPITAFRVTTTQKNSQTQCFVRNLVLEKE